MSVVDLGDKTSIGLDCRASFVGSTPDVVRESLGFEWSINSTLLKSSRPVSSDLVNVSGSKSHFVYSLEGGVPVVGGETVICQPYTSVGASNKPCIFHIKSSGRRTA